MCEPHAVHNMSVVSQGLVINKIYFFICYMKSLLRFILYIRETSVVTCIYLICSNNKGHPLREGVDWNKEVKRGERNLVCHPLREGVDWNYAGPWRKHHIEVTLYVRVWIETDCELADATGIIVTLYVRVWIETPDWTVEKEQPIVTLYVRVWIETNLLPAKRMAR